MAAERQDIVHWVGKYRKIKFGPVKDRHGDLVSLAGATATWRMGKKASGNGGTNILIDKDSGSSGGIQITVADWYGENAYTIEVTLVSADTINLSPCVPPQKYYHECEVTKADGNPITVADGYFDLRPSITN